MKASIVIPTYNGGELLIGCIKSIFAQKFNETFEIVIIDSESNDGSLKIVCNLLKTQLLKYQIIPIKQKDFKHGKSRNLAIQHCLGEIIILLTQDAIPSNNTWLSNLVSCFEADPKIVGVFGRHKAHVNHSKIIHRDIDNHFWIMSQTPIRMIEDLNEYHRNEAIRQKLHFFSNNNSAIRKAIWNDIPFPDVAYGEDQTWAKTIIEKGYKIQYCPESIVYHSHDYGFRETFKRTLTEVVYFQNHFNYNLSKSPVSFLLELVLAISNDFRWLSQNRCFSLLDFSKSIISNLSSNLARLYCYFERKLTLRNPTCQKKNLN